MREKFKSKVFSRYFISYLAVVFLIIALACSALLTSAMRSYQAEKERSASFQISQASDAFASVLDECASITYQISLNGQLSRTWLEKHPVNVIEGIEKLSEYLLGSAYVENVLLYFPGSDIVYANNGTTDTRVAAATGGFDVSIAEKVFSGKESSVFVHNQAQRKLYLYTYFYAYSNRRSGVAVYTFSGDRVQKLLHSYLGSLSAYALYSGDELLCSFQWEEAYYDGERLAAAPDGMALYASGPSTVIATADTGRKLTYIGVYSAGMPFGLERGVVQYLLLMALLGLILSYVFAKRHYKPIDQLMKISTGGKARAAAPEVYENEFEHIRTTLISNRSQNATLHLKLQAQQQLLKEEILSKMMGGFWDEQDLEMIKMHVDFDMDHTPYRVLALFVATDKGHPWQRELLDDLTHRLANTATMTSYNDCVVLVTADDVHKRVITLVKAAAVSLCGEDEVALSMCVSLPHLTVKALPEAVLEALMALSHIMDSSSDPGEAVNYVARAGAQAEGPQNYLEKEFAFSIAQGKELNAMACLDEIQNQSIADGQYQYVSYRLLSVLWQAIQDIPMACDEDRIRWSKQMDALKDTAKSMNPLLFRSLAATLLAEVCDMYRLSQVQLAEQKARDVRAFIEENYCDHNLSLSSLADEFGHSGYYWSRYIKETFGVNFVILLRRMRIDKAKQLLTSTKMPLSDIVNAIGYVDVTSFIRRFKEEEGTTPAQYRSGCGSDASKR